MWHLPVSATALASFLLALQPFRIAVLPVTAPSSQTLPSVRRPYSLKPAPQSSLYSYNEKRLLQEHRRALTEQRKCSFLTKMPSGTTQRPLQPPSASVGGRRLPIHLYPGACAFHSAFAPPSPPVDKSVVSTAPIKTGVPAVGNEMPRLGTIGWCKVAPARTFAL